MNNKHQLKEIDAYYDSLKIKLDPNQYSLLPIGIVTYLTTKTNENNHHLIKLSKKQLNKERRKTNFKNLSILTLEGYFSSGNINSAYFVSIFKYLA